VYETVKKTFSLSSYEAGQVRSIPREAVTDRKKQDVDKTTNAGIARRRRRSRLSESAVIAFISISSETSTFSVREPNEKRSVNHLRRSHLGGYDTAGKVASGLTPQDVGRVLQDASFQLGMS